MCQHLFILLFPLPEEIDKKKYYKKCPRFYYLYFLLGFYGLESNI